MGEWFDPTSGRIKIGITSDGYEQSVEQDLDDVGLATHADIVSESASWSALTSAEESLAARLESLLHDGLLTIEINPEGDALTVEKADSLSSAQQKEISEAVASVSVPTQISEAPTPLVEATADACERGACSPPLRGGVRVETTPNPPHSTFECTAGFIARSKYDNKPYILTAGHCIRDGNGVGQEWQSESPDGSGEHKIGPAHSYVFGASQDIPGGTTSEGDAGLIAISSTSFWSHPLEAVVIVYGNSAYDTTRNERYVIHGTRFNPQEVPRQGRFVVCIGGVGEGEAQEEACGVTTGIKRIITYREGTTVHNLSEINVCNGRVHEADLTPGTSGAPAYKNHFAYGIHSGSNGKCGELYEGINTAESVLHVHILTGAPYR